MPRGLCERRRVLREGCGGTCGMWHEMRCDEMPCCVFLFRLALALAPSSFPDGLATLLSRRRSLYSIPVLHSCIPFLYSLHSVSSPSRGWGIGVRRFVALSLFSVSLYCSPSIVLRARAREHALHQPTHARTRARTHTHTHAHTCTLALAVLGG